MKNLDPFPVLETERLLLRQPTTSDLEHVLFLRSDRLVLTYLKKAPMKDLAEAELFLKRLENNRRAGESIEWCIEKKPTSTMIGSICLWNFSLDQTKAEVGYLLHPGHHGQGVMSEALKVVLGFGFRNLNFQRIEAYTHKENLRSIRLLQKQGFMAISGATDPDNDMNVILYTTAGNFR